MFFAGKSLKGPKSRKTIEEQRKLVHEREKKAMENCRSWKGLRSDKNIANYDGEKNLSLQSLQMDDKSKPRAASRSVSFLLPNLPTAKLVKLLIEQFVEFSLHLINFSCTLHNPKPE